MPEDTGESTESNQTNLEPEQAANAKDVLLALYQLECERAAHHQDQRAAGTNLILVFAGALVLVITYDGKLGFVDAVLGWALAVVGLLGAVMSYTGALHKSRLVRRHKQDKQDEASSGHVVHFSSASDSSLSLLDVLFPATIVLVSPPLTNRRSVLFPRKPSRNGPRLVLQRLLNHRQEFGIIKSKLTGGGFDLLDELFHGITREAVADQVLHVSAADPLIEDLHGFFAVAVEQEGSELIEKGLRHRLRGRNYAAQLN